MVEPDATAPPPEVAPLEQPPATAATQQKPPAAAEGEGDHKRKLEAGTEANGAGEDAKRPRVEGDGASVSQNNESSEKVEEPAAASTEGAVDAENGKVAPLRTSRQSLQWKQWLKLHSKKVAHQVSHRRLLVRSMCPTTSYWATEMHVGGFRFDLASIMTRRSSLWDRVNVYGSAIEGDMITTGTPLVTPPLIDMISNDPILGGAKVFICEQKLYTRAQLNHHVKTGDSEVDGSEVERSGFAGHPMCEFCKTPFYGDNELYTHMSREHYS